jgi:hypothetical protein
LRVLLYLSTVDACEHLPFVDNYFQVYKFT